MDQVTLVENQIDDGDRLVRQLLHDGFDVTAAFWLKASEDGNWFLYVASRAVDDMGPAQAYRDVYRSLETLQDPWISLSEIKLIGATNPVAKDVLKIQKRSHRRIPTRYRGPRLGGVAIEEAYIYPPVDLNMPVVISVVRDVKVDQDAKKITVIKKRVELPPGTVVGKPFVVEYSGEHPGGKPSEGSIQSAIKNLPPGWTYSIVDEK